MANIKSQIKRIGQNERRRIRNKSVRSEIKTFVGRFHKALTSGDKEVAGREMVLAVKKLDRAAEKGIIHKNNAANKKSSIMRQFSNMA